MQFSKVPRTKDFAVRMWPSKGGVQLKNGMSHLHAEIWVYHLFCLQLILDIAYTASFSILGPFFRYIGIGNFMVPPPSHSPANPDKESEIGHQC